MKDLSNKENALLDQEAKQDREVRRENKAYEERLNWRLLRRIKSVKSVNS